MHLQAPVKKEGQFLGRFAHYFVRVQVCEALSDFGYLLEATSVNALRSVKSTHQLELIHLRMLDRIIRHMSVRHPLGDHANLSSKHTYT
jgi:hypothetical protein